MDFHLLTDVATELGYQLAMSGAETFRIEESINRIMATYEIQAEVFAIPNCLHVSAETPDGKPITRMRRIGQHGNNLDSVEKYSNLSRKICAERPDPETAALWLREAKKQQRTYPLSLCLLGSFLGAGGFSILFGGSLLDGFCGGICGLLVGLISRFMDNQKANLLFKTITASFFMAFVAHLTGFLHIARNTDTVIIGALMLLVPGLLFTNAMRDIIYGDTNSGINRIVQVFLIAAALALGTGAAWPVCNLLWTPSAVAPIIENPLWLEAIACCVSCYGFVVLFNIHGKGSLLCVLGGILTWITYRFILQHSGDDLIAYFWATIVASLYAEIMARIRKYPAISYLIISAFPLIPGAGVYYTMRHVINGNLDGFISQGMHTISIAGVMAVGILLTSTAVRIVMTQVQKNKR